MLTRKDFREGAISTIAENLASREPGVHRPRKEDVVLACGEGVCSKVITIFDDGSQQRGRRPVTLETLAAADTTLIVTSCDTHGGRKLPTTEQIDGALGYEPVTHAEAQQLLVDASIDSNSDGRLLEDIAKSFGLVARTEVDFALLEDHQPSLA